MKLHEVKSLKTVPSKSVADLGIKYTGGDFRCGSEKLTSLEGSPLSIDGDFYCPANYLTSLKGGPSSVTGSFTCSFNPLTSLKGGPSIVGEDFHCMNRANEGKLVSLEGAPSVIGGNLDVSGNRITSLKSIHRIIKQIGSSGGNFNGAFICSDNPIEDGWEYILLIKGVQDVSTNNKVFDDAANAYLENNPSGSMKAVFAVQELMNASK